MIDVFLRIDLLSLASGACYRIEPTSGIQIRGFDTFLLLDYSNWDDEEVWDVRVLLPNGKVVSVTLAGYVQLKRLS